MKTLLLIFCVFALSDVLSLVIPAKDYLKKFDYGEEYPLQVIGLVSNEEQLLSKRVGRQYYGQEGQPTQYYSRYYTNYPNPSYPNYNRRSYQSQHRRQRFGGIGSAIIV